MTAVFSVAGTWPVCREWLMTLEIMGFMTQSLDFNNAVRKWSRAQVDCFIFLMRSSTSRCEMSEKQQNGWKFPGSGSTVGIGKAEELERREQMASTFCLKKVIQLLQLSSVGF